MTDINIKLTYGSHASPESGMCVMEAVAYVAGEVHTDAPTCACPVAAAAARCTNDWMDDSDRAFLAPLIFALAGSKSTPEIEQRRAYIAADYAVRIFAPIALRATKNAGLRAHAKALEALPRIIDKETADSARYAADSADSAADSADSAAAARYAADSARYAAAADRAASAADHAAAAARYADSAADSAAAARYAADSARYAADSARYAARYAADADARKLIVGAAVHMLSDMLALTEPLAVNEQVLTRLAEVAAMQNAQ